MKKCRVADRSIGPRPHAATPDSHLIVAVQRDTRRGPPAPKSGAENCPPRIRGHQSCREKATPCRGGAPTSGPAAPAEPGLLTTGDAGRRCEQRRSAAFDLLMCANMGTIVNDEIR